MMSRSFPSGSPRRSLATTLAMLLVAAIAAPAFAEQAEAAGEAEAPHHPHLDLGDTAGDVTWPLQMFLPDPVVEKLKEQSERQYNRYMKRKQRGEMPVLVWTPPEAERIRAVLIISILAHSIYFGEHEATREVATRQEMGIIYLRSGANRELIQGILDGIAERTGIEEYRQAPWITWGMSANGRFPTYMTWAHPERSVASIVWHGEVPPWGGDYPPDWAKFGHSHLHVNLNGQNEWAGTWHRHVRPGLLNYRIQKGWLPHQVVAPGIGHGDHPEGTLGQRRGWTAERTEEDPVRRMSRFEGFDYMALFVDRALSLRLPEEGYPTEGPLELRQVDQEQGYLIHPRAVEELIGRPWRPLRLRDGGDEYQVDPERRADAQQEREEITEPLIQPARDVDPDRRKHLFWVADRDLAEAWWKLHAIDDQPFPMD